MRSTFSVSTWTWALAGCLALSLGCMQGEGERCEIDSDCSGDLKCFKPGSPNDGICRTQGAGGSSGQSTGADTSTATSTDTSVGTSTETSTPDASVAPTDGTPDASVAPIDGSPDVDLTGPDATLAD